MICRSQVSFTSSRSFSIACSAVNLGSVTSTWVRMCCTPVRISCFIACLARSLISSLVRWAFVSLQRWIPSKREPVLFAAAGFNAETHSLNGYEDRSREEQLVFPLSR